MAVSAKCCGAEEEDGVLRLHTADDVFVITDSCKGKEIGRHEALHGHLVAAATQHVAVSEAAAQAADVGVHAVLHIESCNGIGVRLCQTTKEGVSQGGVCE